MLYCEQVAGGSAGDRVEAGTPQGYKVTTFTVALFVILMSSRIRMTLKHNAFLLSMTTLVSLAELVSSLSLSHHSRVEDNRLPNSPITAY